MKSTIIVIAALASAGMAEAQEWGRVLSSTAVIGQVAVPQQFCSDTSVIVPGQRHGAGAAIGAITGAVIGTVVGRGGGRAAGTVIGMAGGAVIGDQLEGRGPDQIQQVRQCTTYTAFENRVLHYDVVYEYAGRQYAVQMPHDPGQTIPVQVAPVGMLPAAPQTMATISAMRVAPAITTIHSSTEYVPYVAPVFITPIVIGLPAPGWRHTPHQRQHSQRSGAPYPRHQTHGQRPHWR